MCIYHLLSRAFRQSITITKVINLNIANVIAILGVNVLVESVRICGRGLGTSASSLENLVSDMYLKEASIVYAYRADRGHVYVLHTLASLDLSIDPCSGGSGSGSRVLVISHSWASRVARNGTATASYFRIPVGG